MQALMNNINTSASLVALTSSIQALENAHKYQLPTDESQEYACQSSHAAGETQDLQPASQLLQHGENGDIDPSRLLHNPSSVPEDTGNMADETPRQP